MVTGDMNRQARDVMDQWDPFSQGSGKYDAEILDVIAQLQVLDDPSNLAKQIQRIYEINFKQWIPLERCVDVSYKLLALKFEAKSII